MVGSEMLRMRFSDEVRFSVGLGLINRPELNENTETPPPLPVSLEMCVVC